MPVTLVSRHARDGLEVIVSDAEMTFVDADPQTWTVVDNTFLGAEGISWKATALLIYLKGRPPGWKVRPSQLAKVKRDGIDSVRSGLRELEEAGYLRRERARDEQGRITGVTCYFSWHPRWSDPQTGNPHVDGPHVDSPPVEDRPLVSTEVHQELSEPTTDSPRPRKRAKEACDPEAEIIAESLSLHVADLPGARKRIDYRSWVPDIEKMLRIDRIDAIEIIAFLEWLYTDPDSDVATFWRVNVRSGAKLRERWDEIHVRKAAEDLARDRRRARVDNPKQQTTRLEDSRHPASRSQRHAISDAIWAAVMAMPVQDRAWEVEGAAEQVGISVAEACRIAGRDPVTFERLAVA